MKNFVIACKAKNLIKELDMIEIVQDIIKNKSATAVTVTPNELSKSL